MKIRFIAGFALGILAAYFVQLVFTIKLNSAEMNLIPASVYYDKCQRMQTCKLHFKPIADANSPEMEYLREYNLPGIKCLASNEDPNSRVICYREDNGFEFDYSAFDHQLTVIYGKGAVLVVTDRNKDGDIDYLTYHVVNDEGATEQVLYDNDMNGQW